MRSSLPIAVLLLFFQTGLAQNAPTTRRLVTPVLELPEAGFDNPESYNKYRTRFFRDNTGNALQIILIGSSGRIVHVWANDANESIGLTARVPSGAAAEAFWDSENTEIYQHGPLRQLTYSLVFPAARINIGHVLLSSMRVERDFQYQERHVRPFTPQPAMSLEEVERMIRSIEQLPDSLRHMHLHSLDAASIAELETRMRQSVTKHSDSLVQRRRIEQVTLDGRNRLVLELRTDPRRVVMEDSGAFVALSSLHGDSIRLSLTLGTDSPALTPLTRDEMFDTAFLEYCRRLRVSGTDKRQLHWLERQLEGLELLSYKEKLMAGLPNFATYFGRDMMMSALMMEPIWKPAMLEYVVGSALTKLSSAGEVSHEEALGWQAIRENAGEYNNLIERYFELLRMRNKRGADSILKRAHALAGNIQRVRENFTMVDDDFQLPVLAARYLRREDVGEDRKRRFLESPSGPGKSVSRLRALLRNLALVVRQSAPYAEQPVATRLVAFPPMGTGEWMPGSWRDSRAGYANGKYAMDINTIWVPHALQSVDTIGKVLRKLGYSREQLRQLAPEIVDSHLDLFLRKPATMRATLAAWRESWRHFRVTLSSQEASKEIQARLQWLPPEEGDFWRRIYAAGQRVPPDVTFLALSLDEDGKPLQVMHTDVATQLFLADSNAPALSRIIDQLNVLLRPYPLGLFVDTLGVLVANDAYASREIWERFRKDRYHSPYVIWGREVNLLQLGLSTHIHALSQEAARKVEVRTMREMLMRIVNAVEMSGLKHNELWSYRIRDGRLYPVRYGTSSDVQLWNLTDLAVRYMLDR